MLITRTPLRVSFLGGGTDFKDFYQQEGGTVLSTAIDKYVFVIIKNRFDSRLRVGYTRTELVDTVEEVEHDLVRESLRKAAILRGVEITTLSDIPSAGSGMGSSSTVTVGLLNAMHSFSGRQRSQMNLAREACEVEIDRLGKPIGVQDQYIVALGGLRCLSFGPGGDVSSRPLQLDPQRLEALESRLMLFYTNQTRRSESILAEQLDRVEVNRDLLRRMKALVEEGVEALQLGSLDCFGELLHRGWELKRELASGISNPTIDALYNQALQAGALGGKVSGAGGGGFLLLYCPPEFQDRLRAALGPLRELPFRFEPHGTKVILDHPRATPLS